MERMRWLWDIWLQISVLYEKYFTNNVSNFRSKIYLWLCFTQKLLFISIARGRMKIRQLFHFLLESVQRARMDLQSSILACFVCVYEDKTSKKRNYFIKALFGLYIIICWGFPLKVHITPHKLCPWSSMTLDSVDNFIYIHLCKKFERCNIKGRSLVQMTV